MVARRLLVIAAVLMGVTAITASLVAPAPRERAADPLPTFDPLAPPSTPSALVERTLETSARKAPVVAVDEGDQLRLTVRGDVLGSVELVGLGLVQALAPESPAVFDVLADDAGSYPVVLSDGGRRVGTVRVSPARE